MNTSVPSPILIVEIFCISYCLWWLWSYTHDGARIACGGSSLKRTTELVLPMVALVLYARRSSYCLWWL